METRRSSETIDITGRAFAVTFTHPSSSSLATSVTIRFYGFVQSGYLLLFLIKVILV